MSVTINYNRWNVELKFDVENGYFYEDVSNENVVKYLKGIFTNKARFEERFITVLRDVHTLKSFFPKYYDNDKFFDLLTEGDDNTSEYYYPFVKWVDKGKWTDAQVESEHAKLNELYFELIEKVGKATPAKIQEIKKQTNNTPIEFIPNDLSIFKCDDALDELLYIYDHVKPYTYEEAFKIENEEFQAMVFGSIDIVEMIKELGHTRIETAGKRVKHKDFSPAGEFLGWKEYDVVYETHRVNCDKLDLEEDAYALRCWCTTTDKEHWLWIEDEYKDNPLEAVASTMRVHSNIIPHIKEIKRQGDILLIETNSDIVPDGELVPLTADQYFGFLSAQS